MLYRFYKVDIYNEIKLNKSKIDFKLNESKIDFKLNKSKIDFTNLYVSKGNLKTKQKLYFEANNKNFIYLYLFLM